MLSVRVTHSARVPNPTATLPRMLASNARATRNAQAANPTATWCRTPASSVSRVQTVRQRLLPCALPASAAPVPPITIVCTLAERVFAIPPSSSPMLVRNLVPASSARATITQRAPRAMQALPKSATVCTEPVRTSTSVLPLCVNPVFLMLSVRPVSFVWRRSSAA